MRDAPDPFAVLDDRRMADGHLTGDLAHAESFHQQEQNVLLCFSQLRDDEVDDVLRDQFAFKINGVRRIDASFAIAAVVLAVLPERHEAARPFV